MSSSPVAADLRSAAVAALRALGAEVRLFPDADNCVRRREPGDGDDPARAASLPFVIEVQGVPNLLHELAHVVLLGRVEQDHATEYAQIPFDLASARGRALLFDELACCAASCAFHPGDDAAADAWFDEQVGIQGLFFGFERDPAGFLAAADAQVRAHRGELDAAVARALLGIERQLAEGGADCAGARPRRAAAFARRWEPLIRPGRSRADAAADNRSP